MWEAAILPAAVTPRDHVTCPAMNDLGAGPMDQVSLTLPPGLG